MVPKHLDDKQVKKTISFNIFRTKVFLATLKKNNIVHVKNEAKEGGALNLTISFQNEYFTGKKRLQKKVLLRTF